MPNHLHNLLAVQHMSMDSYTGSPLIFRIANETLCDVFLLNTNRATVRYDTSRQIWSADHDPRLTTRYSSQVCQRWRNVALGYSTIWSRIIDYNEDRLPWIEELLRRSHPTTIELDLGQVQPFGRIEIGGPKLPVLRHVMSHAQRLKTVNMSVEQDAWQEICEGILQTQAPNLEYFHLTILFIKNTLVFTGTLFSDDAPCLRRLHLRRCLVNLSSTTLSNLTELSLKDITSGAPTVDAWFTILENMPFLSWLTIVDAISGPFPMRLLPTPCLPNLSCLSLKANFPECITLVDHITCPPLGVLRLKCTGVTSGLTLRRLSSAVEERLNLWRMPAKADRRFVFQCLKLEGDFVIRIGNSRQIGCVWNVSESEGANEVLEDPVLSIELCFANFEELESSALPFLLAFSSDFTTVRCLTFWLDSATEHMLNRFMETLLLFQNVEEIDLLYNSPLIFLPALQTLSHIGETATLTIFLPSLRTLRLTETDFKGPTFNILVSYIQYRQRILAPIGILEIVDSYFSRAQRDVLKQFSGLDLIINAYYDESDE